MKADHCEAEKDARMILDLRDDSINMNLASAYLDLTEQLRDAHQAIEAYKAAAEELQRRCAILEHTCVSAAISLNVIDLSVLSNLAKAEIVNSIEVINKAIKTTFSDAEKWMNEEIARQLGEPVAWFSITDFHRLSRRV